MPRYSLVIPVHNEQDDVEELARRIAETLKDSYEIIFVDDGSTDKTWERLQQIRRPGVVRLIKFRTNFGKAAALMAGFAATRGEIVFTMDGDLQDDPAELPRFLAKLDEGYDLVSGWKKTRHDPLNKVVASRIFNFVVRKTTGVELHDMNCGFKAYRGDLARRVRIYGELHRYIPALAAHQGYRIGEIEVEHHPRVHGRSKYGVSRLFKGFVDLVTVKLTTEYATRPAHGFGWAALACAAVSAISWPLTVFGDWDIPIGDRTFSLVGLLIGCAVFWSLSAVILFAAGWLAELGIAPGLRSNPESLFNIEDQLD